MADLTNSNEDINPNTNIEITEDGLVGVLHTPDGDTKRIPPEIVADVLPEVLKYMAAKASVTGVVSYNPAPKPDRDKTPNIGLIRPRANEIRPSANDIGLLDWNRNMSVIDAYIAQIMEDIKEIEAGSTFKPLPAEIPTAEISTDGFCQELMDSELVETNILYTAWVTLTNGPAGNNVAVDLTIRKIGSYVILQANSEITSPYEWFYHYADADHKSGSWVPYGGNGGGGTSNYEDLTNKPSINGTELIGDVALETIGGVTEQEMNDYKDEVNEELDKKVGVEFNAGEESLRFG